MAAMPVTPSNAITTHNAHILNLDFVMMLHKKSAHKNTHYLRDFHYFCIGFL